MSMEQGTRTRLATILILLLILATGAVLGIAADRRLETRSQSASEASLQDEAGPSGEEEAEGEESPRRRRLIVEQVGLSPEQKAQVDSIVAHYRQEMRDLQDELQVELRQAYTPRYRGLLEETREEIRGVLTPDQRMEYDSLLVEHDRRRDQRRDRDSISDSRG